MIEILGLLFILGINLVSFVLNMAGLDCLRKNVIGLCFFFFGNLFQISPVLTKLLLSCCFVLI